MNQKSIASYLEDWLRQNIEKERDKYAAELDGLRREKDKLERQRKKLLEAHYNDAILQKRAAENR
ncbi:hypothetical protein D7V86_00460 [bacterium D16-51]|nr:hypothetical protein D7V96_05225 [bacterium D16-59]RKI62709.1 hypothetical protein D7V86_00460 [bacterium D16-51]